MRNKSSKNNPSVRSSSINNSNSFTSWLNRLRSINCGRVVVLSAIVASLAIVSYTVSSASSSGGPFGGRPSSPATTAKPSSASRVAAVAKALRRTSANEGQAAGDAVLGTGDLRIERSGHTATKLADGRVLIVGGENERGLVKKSETFDPSSRESSSSARLKVPRREHTATMLPDGRVLVIGGHGQHGLLDSTEIFDPIANSFSRGPSLNRARAGHTATVLADGSILIVGGDAEGSAEIFDPATERFGLIVARLNVPRASHSAALLKSGRVLIAGGLTGDSAAVQSGEIFDPETTQFSATRNLMHGARIRPTLRVLPDGKVQMIGGDDERSMEMFNVDGEYFTAYARLLPDSDSVSAILRAQTRAGLIRETTPGEIKLQALPSLLDELLDRGENTLTDMPDSGRAVVAGGKNGRGKALKSVVILSSSSATVTTDKTDYAPGETVIITGTNWQPGETVDLTLHRDNGAPDTLLSAVADPDGNIRNDEYVVQESDLGVAFLLTATGQTSGFTAQTTFTDASPHNVNFATSGLPGGVSVTVTWSKTNPGGNPASGSTAFTSPGPSAAQGTEPGTAFTYSFPASLLVSGTTTYSLTGSSPPSGFTTGGAGGTTTVTGTYAPACAIPTAFSVTGGGAYCTGGTGVPVGLSGSEVGVNYQLKKDGSNAGSPVTGSGSALSFVNQTAAGTYTVQATNATTGCTAAMNGSATVTVNPLPSAFSLTGGGAYCAGGTGVSVGLSGSEVGVNYQLKKDGSDADSPVTGTGSALSFVNQTAAGTYTVQATNATTGCTAAMNGSATVTVNPLPTAFSLTGGGPYCAGGTGVPVGLIGSEVGVNYQLKKDGSNVDAPVAGTGSALSFGIRTMAGTYTVQATNTTTGCSAAMAGSAIVTVNPLPTATVSGGGTTCAGGSASISAALTGTGPWSVTWSDGVTQNGVVSSPAMRTVSPVSTTIYTVTSVSDANTCSNTGNGSATVIVNTPPVINSVTGPSSPIAKGNAASITVNFTDVGILNDAVMISWDDGFIDTIASPATSPTTRAHTYAEAGVYTVVVTVTDGCGESDTESFQYIVVYDPSAGFVTGGGWINSPANTYAADPSLTGRANFGFVSKYQRGSTVPVGETEFQFQVAGFKFHSTVYEWLVVSSFKAQYRGSGTVNGTGDYGFLLTAYDGQVSGGGGVDRFRIKIWDKNQGNGVVYDNRFGISDDIDAADPQAIGGGSIVVHR